MSSIGEILAKAPKLNERSASTERKKCFYFGVFFDGTGNNMIQPERAKKLRESQEDASTTDLDTYKSALELSKNGGNSVENIESNESDFSNIAVLHSSYNALSDQNLKEKIENGFDVYRYNVYVEGAGTDDEYTGSIAQKMHNFRGSGFGLGHTGVPALVEKAMIMIQTVVKGFSIKANDEVHFDVFGFSRGATCARMFCHMVGIHEQLECENDFSDLAKNFLCNFNVGQRTVDFLGIYDTVSSIGVNYDNNTTEYGLYSPNEDWVKMVFHIAALDEFRDHFRLTDIGAACGKADCLEVFIPGCHSDVGGGYKTGESTSAIMYAVSRTWNTTLTDHVSRFFRDSWSRRIYVTDPQSRNEINIRKIDIDTLQDMGWYSPAKDRYWTDRVNGILNITRYVRRGYSNIPLQMMAERSKKTGRELFELNEPRFKMLDEDLSKFNGEMLGYVDKENGRYFYIPDIDSYRYLRQNFIHYSSSDALTRAQTNIVHAPTVHDNTVVRIVYHGDKGDNSVHYMFEYE